MVKVGWVCSNVLTYAIMLKIGQQKLPLFNIILQVRPKSQSKNNFQSTVTKKASIFP